MEIHRYKYFAIRRLAIIEKLSDENARRSLYENSDYIATLSAGI